MSVRHTSFYSADLTEEEISALEKAITNVKRYPKASGNGYNKVEFENGYAVAYSNFPPEVKWEIHRKTTVYGRTGR